MVTDPRGIRARVLVVVAVVVAGLSWVILRLLVGSGKNLPEPSWFGVVLFVVLGAALLLVGRPVKRLVAGTNDRPVDPLYAARVLAMSQAAALAGAGILGWYLAQVVLALPDIDVPSQQDTALLLGALAVAAGGVAVVGLVVQGWCRIDDSGRPDDDDDIGGRGGARAR
ncbi:MAG: DUF3180 domain-containing protein [Actinomycetota bacterium]|nr:DUF3180 domain-containing protein [Actinomycetota bacterium]